MGKIVRNREVYSGTYDSATSVNYDNATSGLNAKTVQEAVDEVQGNVSTLSESLVPQNIAPNCTLGTGITALNYGGIFKVGKEIKINCRFTGGQFAKGTTYYICTLPSGMAPSKGYNNHAVTTFAYNGDGQPVGIVYITSAGVLEYRCTADINAIYLNTIFYID